MTGRCDCTGNDSMTKGEDRTVLSCGWHPRGDPRTTNPPDRSSAGSIPCTLCLASVLWSHR